MKKKITSLIILFMMVVSVAWSADTLRLSQLPTTTTLTPATDTLPVVASGLTRKITVANLLSYATGGAGTITGTGYNYYIPYWTGSTSLGAITPGTSGYVLTSNGSGSAPSFQPSSTGGNVSNSGTPTAYQWPQWQSAQILSGHTVAANRVVCSGTNSIPTACTNLTDTVYGTTTGSGINHYWPYWTGSTTLGARSITPSRPVCTDASGDPTTCSYSPLVTLWNSGTCSGYLKSDGTCDIPGGTGTITGSGTQYYIPIWTSNSALGSLAALGTSGYVLTSNGAGAAPTFQAVSATAGVSDVAYNSVSWDSVTGIAPSKNAIRDYLESRMPTGTDGTYYLQLSSNTSYTPSAGYYRYLFIAGAPKIDMNGTAYSIVTSPVGSPVTYSTLTNGGICTYVTGGTVNCSSANITGSAGSLTSGGTGTNPKFTEGSSLTAGTGSGQVITGSSLTAGKVYYMASGGLTLAQANAASTLPGFCIADTTTSCMYSGVYRFSATQSWTVGNQIYVSASAAGSLVTTAPSVAGQFVQKVGIALAADTILIMPSLDIGGI